MKLLYQFRKNLKISLSHKMWPFTMFLSVGLKDPKKGKYFEYPFAYF